jgi:hypothetical protein
MRRGLVRASGEYRNPGETGYQTPGAEL